MEAWGKMTRPVSSNLSFNQTLLTSGAWGVMIFGGLDEANGKSAEDVKMQDEDDIYRKVM
jgi:hypothetical protein